MLKGKRIRWFVRNLAKRAKFTQGDIRIILRTFYEIIYEITKESRDMLINSDEEEAPVLNWPGLFDIRIRKIVPHKGFDALRNREMDMDESFKIIITPSKMLKFYMNGKEMD